VADNPTDAHALLAQMGGISGLIYSSLPIVVFVPVSTAFGLLPAIAAALGAAAIILVWRMVRHDSLQPAISGFFGVGISALIAYLVGASKGYFLLGIWSSLLYAAVFALSVLIRRPLVGYISGWFNDHDRGWRQVRRAVVAYDVATLTWVLVFASRFVVQQLLYNADKTGWLGVARIAMGWPLTGVAALATYVAIKAARRAIDEHNGTDPDSRRASGVESGSASGVESGSASGAESGSASGAESGDTAELARDGSPDVMAPPDATHRD
jgi:hypothetical protein